MQNNKYLKKIENNTTNSDDKKINELVKSGKFKLLNSNAKNISPSENFNSNERRINYINIKLIYDKIINNKEIIYYDLIDYTNKFRINGYENTDENKTVFLPDFCKEIVEEKNIIKYLYSNLNNVNGIKIMKDSKKNFIKKYDIFYNISISVYQYDNYLLENNIIKNDILELLNLKKDSKEFPDFHEYLGFLEHYKLSFIKKPIYQLTSLSNIVLPISSLKILYLINNLNALSNKYNNIIKKELKLNNNYSLIDYFIDLLNIKILDNESLCLNNKNYFNYYYQNFEDLYFKICKLIFNENFNEFNFIRIQRLDTEYFDIKRFTPYEFEYLIYNRNDLIDNFTKIILKKLNIHNFRENDIILNYYKTKSELVIDNDKNIYNIILKEYIKSYFEKFISKIHIDADEKIDDEEIKKILLNDKINKKNISVREEILEQQVNLGIYSNDVIGHIYGIQCNGKNCDMNNSIYEYPVGEYVNIISLQNLNNNNDDFFIKNTDDNQEIYLSSSENNFISRPNDSSNWIIKRVNGVTTFDMNYLLKEHQIENYKKSMNGMIYSIWNVKEEKYLMNNINNHDKKIKLVKNFEPLTCGWTIERTKNNLYSLMSMSKFKLKKNINYNNITDDIIKKKNYFSKKNKIKYPYLTEKNDNIEYQFINNYFSPLSNNKELIMNNYNNINNSWIIIPINHPFNNNLINKNFKIKKKYLRKYMDYFKN